MIDLKKQILLVIAPHPDDEVIGCGGLISRVKEEGGKVFVLFLTVGDTNDLTQKGFSSLMERKEEIKKVSRLLEYDGYDIAFEGNDSHLRLDLLGQKKIMNMIEKESSVSLSKVGPTIVAFTSPHSYNQDHRAGAAATHASLRARNSSSNKVRIVMSYEEVADHWSFENFKPNCYITLSEKHVQKKINTMKCYSSQDRPFPSTRSTKTMETLAILRGSLCGEKYAEGYEIHRYIG